MINTQENKERFYELINEVPRYKVKLLDYLETHDYFTAPASTKFHLNCEGGLLEHSLQVYDKLNKLCEVSDIGKKIPEHTRILVSLLHDFCKINLYKPNILVSGKQSDKIPYTHQETLPLGHGEKSAILLSRLIELTDQELMMIRFHMGLFDKAFYENSNKIKELYPEVILFFMADWLSSIEEK